MNALAEGGFVEDVLDAQQTPSSDPLTEERAAAAQQRQVEKMQRGAKRARDKSWQARLAEAIADTGRTYPRCRCELSRDMDRRTLARVESCNASFVCPRLDRVRRTMGI